MSKALRLRTSLLQCMIGCAGVIGLGGLPAFAGPYTSLTTISIPATTSNASNELTSFDISYFDGNTQTYYLADRSNSAVDVLSAATNSLVTQVGTGSFTGAVPNFNLAGPDGVMVANGQLWAGNGDSTVHVYNISGTTYTPLPSISTALPTATTNERADEMAYDATDNVAIVANDAATPSPFVSLINGKTNTVTSQIVLNGSNNTPNATSGIEQSVWMPSNDKFYVSIPQIGGNGDPGGILEIDPTTGAVVKTFDLASFGITGCGPTGLVKGSGNELLIGCGTAGTQTILFDPTANGGSGEVVKTFGFSGSDEVAFDPTNDLFFVTDSSGAQLGLINGLTDTFLGSLATAPGAHSVAVDPVSNEVFVPLGAGAGNTICPGGCVAVFAPVPVPEPSSLTLLVAGGIMMVGIARIARHRRRNSRR